MPEINPYSAPAATINASTRPPRYRGCRRARSARGRRCSKVGFTWWGGALGPKLFSVVRCGGCKAQYNGKTGSSLTKTIIVYQPWPLPSSAG